MSQTIQSSLARPNLRSLLWAVPLAGVLSALVNALIWLALRSVFATIRVGPPGAEMPFWPVRDVARAAPPRFC